MSGTRVAAWRAALRLARREAQRHRARTALVVTLVALPVAAGTFADVVVRTDDLPVAERVTRTMGQADALLQVTPNTRLTRVVPSAEGWSFLDGTGNRDPAKVDVPGLLSTVLPAGSTVVSWQQGRIVRYAAPDRGVRAEAVELDLSRPVTRGIFRPVAGRTPASPHEVAVTPRLLDRLGLRVGDALLVDGGATVRIVGTVLDPGQLGRLAAVGRPGWTGLPASTDAGPPLLLADLPGPATGAAASTLSARLARHGVAFAARAAVAHPPPSGLSGPPVDVQAAGAVAVLVGLGLLEVVLLAGTAFAVGARRQVRDLALVVAAGGTGRDVRRIVLAQGLVAGLSGGAAGVLLGAAAVAAGRGRIEHLADHLLGPLSLRPAELAALVLAGAAAGLAAAAVPARSAARLPVVAALAGRFTRPARPARMPAIGTAAFAAGVAIAALTSWRWHAADLAYARWSGRGPAPAPPGNLRYVAGMLAGFTVAMVGLLLATPMLVAAAGRLGRRLPLTPRLALRDAARHRHRTAPAVAAVMAAVSASVAALFIVASFDARDQASYRPIAGPGQVLVQSLNGDGAGGARAARQLRVLAGLAAAKLPAEQVAVLRQTPFFLQEQPLPGPTSRSSQVAVADVASLRALLGRTDGRAERALATGGAVVFGPEPAGGGHVAVENPHGKVVRLRAAVTAGPSGSMIPGGVVSAATARRLALGAPVPSPGALALITTTRMPTAAEEDAARAAVGDAAELSVERGYHHPYRVGMLALVGAAALITLGGTAVAVSLSAAEGRADLATLAAIGAQPRRRRALAAAQAGTISVLGVGLGLVFGTVVAVTMLAGHVAYPLRVPLVPLAVLGAGVPLLGGALTAAATRSRLPLRGRTT